MCGGLVGLAPQHSKVNPMYDSSPSVPQTLDKHWVFCYYRNIEKTETQLFDFLSFLTFS